MNGDGCDSNCRLENNANTPNPSCGDGIVDIDLGETCDDGNTVS